MLTDTLKKAFQRTWWALVIRGALAVTVGVLIFVKPLDSVAVFALVIAIWALANGITEIVYAIDLRAVFTSWWMLLLGGLVSAGFGVAAFYYYPALSLAFAVAWVSFWLSFSGIFGIAVAVQQKKLDLPWGWTLTWGLICIAGGIAALVSPPATLVAIMGFMAGIAIISGITLLIAAFRLRSMASDIRNTVRQPATS